jgi:hypothetical protein
MSRAQLHAYTKTHILLYLHSPLNDMRVPLVTIIFVLLSSSLSHLCFSTAGAPSHPVSRDEHRVNDMMHLIVTRPHRIRRQHAWPITRARDPG